MSHGKPGIASGNVRTHPLPPHGFDPRAATARELRRYGLPQRPDPASHPKLAKRWDEVFSRNLTYITPSFQPLEELVPGIKPRSRARPDVTAVTNPTWSGAVVHATGKQTFTWVLGQWNVPDVAPAVGGKGSEVSFAFVGIDGNTDVTQIGTIQSVSTATNGSVSKSCYAVYEWFPNSWSAITNLPVNFGDTMIGLICMDSPTEAFFSLVNVTSSTHAGFIFDAPSGTVSLENQAEWTFERPEVGGVNPPLPNFGEIYFDSAMGGHGLDFVANAGTDTTINMVVDGKTVATTTVETPTLIKIAYTGG
jgi:Peptidase A4 family